MMLSRLIIAAHRHRNWINRSSIMQWIIRRTFYPQYCCGMNEQEVSRTFSQLKQSGITGFILTDAKEVDPDEAAAKTGGPDTHLQQWLARNLEAVRLCAPEDFVALKYSGAGEQTVAHLKRTTAALQAAAGSRSEMSIVDLRGLGAIKDTVSQICDAAIARGVRVVVDAESQVIQRAIDHVAMEVMSAYNRRDRANVYNTYQMYLKSSFGNMQRDLSVAAERGFALGVKLVRGAYLRSEADQNLLQDGKEDSDKAYDGAFAYLLAGNARSDTKWTAEVMLASHNSNSLFAAAEQWFASPMPSQQGGGLRALSFAQLLGMADELTLALASLTKAQAGRHSPTPIYKYGIWGSPGECLYYMLRRAEENLDSLARSRDSRRATRDELLFRLGITRQRIW